MDLQKEAEMLLSSGVTPMSFDTRTLYDCKSGEAIARSVSLIINGLSRGSLTEADYLAVAERSKRGILLFAKTMSHADKLLCESPEGFVVVQAPLTLLTKVNAVETLKTTMTDAETKLNRLCLAFPVRILSEASDKLVASMNALQNAGVKLMLTDFGDAMCPVMMLASFSFDYVSLHPQAAELLKSRRAGESVKGLMSFINGLGSKIVLPNLSSADDKKALSKLGVAAYTQKLEEF